MTTMTDDIGSRLAAVESDIRNINTQLAELNANQRQMGSEHQADMRSINERFDQVNGRIDQVNDRIDRLNGRIDRVFWGVIGIGSGIIVTMLGLGITIILRMGTG